MPKLPILTAQKLIRVVQKKGFVLHRTVGSHHIFVHPKEKLTISIPMHKGRDLGRGITLAILHDAHISAEECKEML